MKHKPTPDQRLVLFRLESGYHFDVLAGKEPPNLRCTIIERNSKKPYASAIGFDEADALAKALTAATTAVKPETPVEVSQERDRLKAELDALRAKGTQAPVEAMPPAPSIMDDAKPAATPPRKGKGFSPEPGNEYQGRTS